MSHEERVSASKKFEAEKVISIRKGMARINREGKARAKIARKFDDVHGPPAVMSQENIRIWEKDPSTVYYKMKRGLL